MKIDATQPARIELVLPSLHEGQKRIVREARRFNVLACGRRFGKTILGIDFLVDKALDGYPVGWFSPQYPMLIEARGNISHAARQLGCARYTVQAWINRTPQLQQVLKDQREAMIDQAENALVMAIEQLQGWAVCFALKCLGKERGYVESQQVQQSGTVEVIVRREDRRNTTSEN